MDLRGERETYSQDFRRNPMSTLLIYIHSWSIQGLSLNSLCWLYEVEMSSLNLKHLPAPFGTPVFIGASLPPPPSPDSQMLQGGPIVIIGIVCFLQSNPWNSLWIEGTLPESVFFLVVQTCFWGDISAVKEEVTNTLYLFLPSFLYLFFSKMFLSNPFARHAKNSSLDFKWQGIFSIPVCGVMDPFYRPIEPN